jgi:rSAM/selenodomain-associated transferase 1
VSRRGTVIVFAREAVLGAVKRRLARDVGAIAAVRFYRQTTTHLLRRLRRDSRWSVIVAMTPDRAARRLGALPQGRGDLGRRMARALRRAAPGSRILIGSDIPGIRPPHIAAAFRALGRHELVFGPARAGGYWLVGTRLRTLPPDLFEGVRWSTKHALADTLATVPGQRRIGFADRLEDVDDGAAWRRLSP